MSVKARKGDPKSLKISRYVLDQLRYLQRLGNPPREDTATLKLVQQSKRYLVWRLSHPYDLDVAVRTICWFDEESDEAVIVLFANDKASMGDVFYNSVGSRADQVIDEWKRQREGNQP